MNTHQQRTALAFVMRQLLIKIYEAGIPLSDGFDEYELWLEGILDQSYDPTSIRNRFSVKGTHAAIVAFHMSLVHLQFDGTPSIAWAESCASSLIGDEKAGTAIVRNMMEDFLNR